MSLEMVALAWYDLSTVGGDVVNVSKRFVTKLN